MQLEASVVVEAGEVYRMHPSRCVVWQRSYLAAVGLGLRDARLSSRVAIADAHHSILQVLMLLLARLDRGQAEEQLVISGLLLAHRRIIGTFGDDRRGGALRASRLQVARRVRALQRLLCLDPRDGAAVTRVELAPIKLAVVLVHARGTVCYLWIDAALDVEICAAARHRVIGALSIEVDVDLGD